MPNPLAALPVVNKVLGIIEEWQKNRPLNKLRYRIEAAIEYVALDEKTGQYKNMNDAEIARYKIHYRKRIFDE